MEMMSVSLPESASQTIAQIPRELPSKFENHNVQVARMEKARMERSFNPTDLTSIIFDSKEAADDSRAAFMRVEKALGADDMSKLPAIYRNSNHQALIRQGFRMGKVTFEDDRDRNNSHFEQKTHSWTLGNSNPLGMTRALFIPSVKLQGTDEQIAYWVPLAESGKIIATYCQTELAHGTFVGGIQTTAIFDESTDEFVINTPSVEAIKFWPGAVGYATTHIFLVARMIIAEKDLGVHSFVVQIRSLEDFKPLPGIELGDIGLKMAYNTIDNGFVRFHNVRIPRTHKLMRFSQVARNGTYTSSPMREKLLYGGLLKGRTLLLRNAPFKLAQALTIATRYSTVRLQGRSLSPDAPHETPIIAYKHQQHRLLTLTAKSYVMHFAAEELMCDFHQITAMQLRGDHSLLPLLHMRMAGVKAWSCQNAADGAEDARKMCGGHGFLAISGLSEIVGALFAMCTFEGDNYVMWGQVGKYLWKSLERSVLPSDLAYVARYREASGNSFPNGADFLQRETHVWMFEQRAATLILQAHAAVSKAVAAGESILRAENDHALLLLAAAKAHIELYILNAAHSFVSRQRDRAPSPPAAILPLLDTLVTLFALSTISSPFSPSTSSFVETLSLTTTQLNELRRTVDELVSTLAPDAITLTDAWDFTDASLASAIGCKDGDVYRRMMSWVRQLEINVDAASNGGVMTGVWNEYVRPFMEKSRL